MSNFIEWFETFIDEKDLPYESWTIESENGTPNIIDTEVVIEHIKIASFNEQKKIKDVIVKIDFANGNVNHFFKYLAGALAKDM